ncbi:hypothetical protein [Kitasatospora sp. NPDC096140]|uniref:hypothetical protein n=1 Tax=Kitasatospora sp. NPDC096140 TaxID=3155425 RepID=UPI0033272203
MGWVKWPLAGRRCEYCGSGLAKSGIRWIRLGNRVAAVHAHHPRRPGEVSAK